MYNHLHSFLEHLRLNRNVSVHTVRAYESDLSQFIEFLAVQLGRKSSSVPVSEFEDLAVRAFMAELYRRGVSRSSSARNWQPYASLVDISDLRGKLLVILVHWLGHPNLNIRFPLILKWVKWNGC